MARSDEKRDGRSAPGTVVLPHPADLPGADLLARLMVQSTDPVSLSDMPQVTADALARAAFAALAKRVAGRHAIVVSALSEAGALLRAIVVVNDDMPFLLDSVMSEIHARGLRVHLVLHPTFKADRAPDGRLVAITGSGTEEWGDGHQESCIAIAVEGLAEADVPGLVAALDAILVDVRHAVRDWRKMLTRLSQAIGDLGRLAPKLATGDAGEALAFLRWLRDNRFTFLGMRELRLEGGAETGAPVTVPGSGLGVLADPNVEVLRRGGELVALTPEVRRFLLEPQPIIITKANVVSRVHRRVHMDYIGVKTYTDDGTLAGELRIVGLFTSLAYTESPREIPILRRKADLVLGRLGFAPDSHDAKALANIIDTFPRDELFQIEPERLAAWAERILDLDLRPRVRVLARPDRFDRFVSLLVFVPRDRYATATREAIGAFLAGIYHGRLTASYPSLLDGPLARVQFIIGRSAGETPQITEADLEARITELIRTWGDRLVENLGSGGDGERLVAKYARAFPAGYAETFSTGRAMEDVVRIERLGPDRPVAIDFHRDPAGEGGRIHAALYRFDAPLPLSERVPMLENLGFRVIDERSYRVHPRYDGVARTVALHDMVIEVAEGAEVDMAGADERLEALVRAVLAGEADNDSFNRLVLLAGLEWREAALLRAYAAYLRQLGVPFGPRYVADTLARHAAIAADLVALFNVRHDPDTAGSPEARAEAAAAVKARIVAALEKVPSADEDRILRLVLEMMLATSRTNFFQREPDGQHRPTIAMKLAPRQLASAPAPRPFAEIWVYCPRVEGVHMRFAPIARGGIRWSDRAQDFRTEVLGLAKAQHVKNAVIVPAGAKGGFLPKQLPRAGNREEVQAEGIAAYRIFISALLDVTDNLVEGAIVPPPRVVRHDGDDPYLVVAADKGTATFSDIANAISAERGHWLGDAFASGGSQGYDHKRMAITSRGAWECVKRHFRDMDRDIAREPFTVAGVGDMSGDVFGNAMMLAPEMRLLAAFDHRDIFLDPEPDPAASLAERKRLFALPRSSWADFDASKLSAGGGVHSRQSKAIPLTPEVRRLLGVEATEMAPADVIRRILTLPVDLLFFGGIGTFIRASSETDAQVGDRANDALRVAAPDVRAKVVGEGANLGVTQRGRIELAGRGGHINTDFIDNSAGVNTSDQEVNIKIALGPAVKDGRLGPEARKTLLVGMTEAVGRASLRNNYQQSLALSLAERRAAADMGSNARLIRVLEARSILDRRLEATPADLELAERQRAGRGLTRPELAVLLSYAKIALLHDLLDSDIPDEPFLEVLLVDYFPTVLSRDFAPEIRSHRLRREIIATALTNMVANRCGPAGAVRLADETGRPVTDVALAVAAARAILVLPELWRRIDGLDGHLSGTIQLGLYARVQSVLMSTAAWFLRQPGRGALGETIAAYRAGLVALQPVVASGLPKDERAARERAIRELVDAKVPADLATAIADLEALEDAPAVIALADARDCAPADAAHVYWGVGEHLALAKVRRRAAALDTPDYFDRLAVGSALATIASAQRRLAEEALADGSGAGLDDWIARNGPRLDRAAQSLGEAAGAGALGVSRLSVIAGQLRDLAGG